MQMLITPAFDAAGGGQANLTTITAPQMATGQMLTPSQVTTVVNHGKWQALQNFIYASDWVSAIAMLNLSPASEWESLTWTAYIFLRDRPASFVVQKEDLRRVNLYATLELLITGTMNTLQSALGETYLHDHDLLSPNLATELRKHLTSFAGDDAANFHTSLIYCLRLVAPTPSTLVSAADLRKTQAYTLQASLRAVVGALTAVFGSCIGPKLPTRVTAVLDVWMLTDSAFAHYSDYYQTVARGEGAYHIIDTIIIPKMNKWFTSLWAFAHGGTTTDPGMLQDVFDKDKLKTFGPFADLGVRRRGFSRSRSRET